MTVLDERFDLEVLRHATRYQQWVLSWFGQAIAGEVAEIGPGIGNFTRWLSPRARSVTAIEPEKDMCRSIEALGLPNVNVLPIDLRAAAEMSCRYDCLFICNVLEHIEDDRQAVAEAVQLLKPGASLCLLVPAHPALFGSLDQLYGHIRRYRLSEVRTLLDGTQLENVRMQYFNPIGAVGWLLVSRLTRRPHLTQGSVRLSERIAVPIGRLTQSRFSFPFGQSIVAIGSASRT